jgi:hypothetical protein
MVNATAINKESRAQSLAEDGAASVDSVSAHVLLANLGFLLVPGPPLDHGAAYLLVAVRPRPTFLHFDPERIDYWAVDRGLSVPARMVWPLPKLNSEFSWGVISVADRLGALNQFVSFGGNLAISRDHDLHAALFRSEAPILSMAGRSGPADPLTNHVCGFLARLRAASGYDSPVKKLAEASSPAARYSAFVASAIDRYRHPDAEESTSPHLIALLRAELHRLESDSGGDFEQGLELAELLFR